MMVQRTFQRDILDMLFHLSILAFRVQYQKFNCVTQYADYYKYVLFQLGGASIPPPLLPVADPTGM